MTKPYKHHKRLGRDARKFEVPSKAEAGRWSMLASANCCPNMQVPVTRATDDYVAALKSEFQAALVRVLLSEPPAPLLTHGACMWEARTLDKTSEEKASDQCCGSWCGAGDGSVAVLFHV